MSRWQTTVSEDVLRERLYTLSNGVAGVNRQADHSSASQAKSC